MLAHPLPHPAVSPAVCIKFYMNTASNLIFMSVCLSMVIIHIGEGERTTCRNQFLLCRDRTRVVLFGSKPLYCLSHLISPKVYFS